MPKPLHNSLSFGLIAMLVLARLANVHIIGRLSFNSDNCSAAGLPGSTEILSTGALVGVALKSPLSDLKSVLTRARECEQAFIHLMVHLAVGNTRFVMKF